MHRYQRSIAISVFTAASKLEKSETESEHKSFVGWMQNSLHIFLYVQWFVTFYGKITNICPIKTIKKESSEDCCKNLAA